MLAGAWNQREIALGEGYYVYMRRCPSCISGAAWSRTRHILLSTERAIRRANLLTDKLAAVMAAIGPGAHAVFGDQFARRPAPDCARYRLGAPVPGLLHHDRTPGAPIWTVDQAKGIMAGISEICMEHGSRMLRQARIDADLVLPASPLRGATVHPTHPLHRRPYRWADQHTISPC